MTREDIPVEVTEVVAGGVFAVVGELDAAAHLHRAALGEDLAPEHALGDEREVLQLLHEFGAEQGHASSSLGWRRRDHCASASSSSILASSRTSWASRSPS